MDPITGGALISGGFGLAGGLLSGSSSKKNIRAQERMNAQNIQLQKDFAQQGIRWKVEDARAAGISPLAALGAPTVSFTPLSLGGASAPDYGQAFSQMGQDLSRAYVATRTAKERAAEVAVAEARQRELDRINLERHRADLSHMELQNQLLRARISRVLRESPPAMPGSAGGTRSAGAVEVVPSKEVSHAPGLRSVEAASTPGFKGYWIGGPRTGFNLELPAGESLSEGLESMGSLYSIGVGTYHHGSRWFDRKLEEWRRKSPNRGRSSGGQFNRNRRK